MSRFLEWCDEEGMDPTRASEEDFGLKAEGISCHALRHSAATWARFGGAKLDAIGDMLGHASADTTRVYSKIVDRMRGNPTKYLKELMR